MLHLLLKTRSSYSFCEKIFNFERVHLCGNMCTRGQEPTWPEYDIRQHETGIMDTNMSNLEWVLEQSPNSVFGSSIKTAHIQSWTFFTLSSQFLLMFALHEDPADYWPEWSKKEKAEIHSVCLSTAWPWWSKLFGFNMAFTAWQTESSQTTIQKKYLVPKFESCVFCHSSGNNWLKHIETLGKRSHTLASSGSNSVSSVAFIQAVQSAVVACDCRV